MRKKLLAFAGVLSLVCIAAVASIQLGLRPTGPVPPGEIDELQRLLAQAAEQAGDGGQIDLTAIVGGDWDHVHIFGAYVSPETIDDELGFQGSPPGAPLWYDGESILVFVRDKTVVHWAELLVGEDPAIRFDWERMPSGIPRSDAEFRVERFPGGWILSPAGA